MKNYTILNIPEDVLRDLKELGTTLFKEAEYKIQPVIDNGAIFRIIIRKGGENKCHNPVRNELFQSIMDRIPFANIITGVMMLNLKPNRFQRVHIDRDRHCAINVFVFIVGTWFMPDYNPGGPYSPVLDVLFFGNTDDGKDPYFQDVRATATPPPSLPAIHHAARPDG